MVSKMEAGKLDSVPIWSDCKTFPAEPFKDRTDLFIASYPCQGFSSAGKRLGADDPRHLWPWVLRFVQQARPVRCFFENVEGHISLGLSTVISDLEAAGYKTTWGIFSASERGAPHRRKRVFIMADSDTSTSGRLPFGEDEEESRPAKHRENGSREVRELDDHVGELRRTSRASGTQRGSTTEAHAASPSGTREGLAHPGSSRCETFGDQSGAERVTRFACQSSELAHAEHGQSESNEGTRYSSRQEKSGRATDQPHGPDGSIRRPFFWPGFVSRPGEVQQAWEPSRVLQTIGGLGGGVNGRAANVDRLRLLGNGVYPATAAMAFVTLDRDLRGLSVLTDEVSKRERAGRENCWPTASARDWKDTPGMAKIATTGRKRTDQLARAVFHK